jgi:hypothetical protein
LLEAFSFNVPLSSRTMEKARVDKHHYHNSAQKLSITPFESLLRCHSHSSQSSQSSHYSLPSCLELPSQEADRFRNTSDIIQVRRQNSQSTQTNRIPNIANNLQLVRGEVRDPATILRILGVAISDHADNLVLDAAREILNGTMNKSCSLAIQSIRLCVD